MNTQNSTADKTADRMGSKRMAVKADTGSRAKVRRLVQIAMMAAVAGVLMVIEFPLPFLAPPFYKMDFSEVPVLIGTFAMGPAAGMLIELIKILINFVLNGTQTAGVGELANFLMGCAFIVPAGMIYKRSKTKKHAIVGLIVGTITMSAASVILNAGLLLPAYGKAFHTPIEAFVEMGSAIIPAIGDSLIRFCLFCVAPFNLIKGIVVSLLTLVLYKHISRLLKGEHFAG